MSPGTTTNDAFYQAYTRQLAFGEDCLLGLNPEAAAFFRYLLYATWWNEHDQTDLILRRCDA